ncbi:MAG: transcriptional repressor LexA [bacterium]|nr:transcriptional repressor LexA [bacterium]
MNILNPKEILALKEIRNAILQNGTSPSVRQLMKALGYSSPRSAALTIESLIKKGFVKKKANGSLQVTDNFEEKDRTATINIPLVGSVACGAPVLAVENIEALIPVSSKIAHPPYKYFMLKAHGDSMNLSGINDGDFVLIRQQETARSGERVVALIDDEATIKELFITPRAYILLPRSTNKEHKPIVLTRDFRIQGVVVEVLPPILD